MTPTSFRGSPDSTTKRIEVLRSPIQPQDAHSAAALRTFAGGLAHAFSNVLGGISGFAQLAKEDINDPVASAAHLEDLLKAARRAREVLQQVLVFSRVQEQRASAVSLATLVANALPRWHATVPANIEIRTRIDPSCPLVIADPDQLDQAIGCLLANAARAIGETGGHIEISVDAGMPSATEAAVLRFSGQYVRFCVSDNGSGIKPDVVDQIFEPFFTTHPTSRGIGLGLPIVEAIVTASGGVVRVDTEPGCGTAFHLYFPAVD